MRCGALSKVLLHTGQGKCPATKGDEGELAEGAGDEEEPDDDVCEGLGNDERDD